MHGKRDDIIPFYHGQRLFDAAPKTSRWPPYFPPRAGHNDLVETDTRMYYGEISSFLEDLKKIADGESVEPPSVDKPPQALMVQGRRTGGSSVVEDNAKSDEIEIVEKVEQEPVIPVGDPTMEPAVGPNTFLGALPEPRVGPEDGRYEEIRKGNLGVFGKLTGHEDLSSQADTLPHQTPEP